MKMKTMQVVRPGMPLAALEGPVPTPGAKDILVRVRACGVCRTDLHVADGELSEGKLPSRRFSSARQSDGLLFHITTPASSIHGS